MISMRPRGKGEFMTRKAGVLCLVALLLSICSCQNEDSSYRDHFWVISGTANIYKRPSRIGQIIGELKFGEEILCKEKMPGPMVPEDWLEAKSGENYGYVMKDNMADKELFAEINDMMEAAKKTAVQASGMTKKKTSLRMKPDNNSKTIELLKEPQKAEVFERIVNETEGKGGKKKHVWYKVRLDDGRVGYISGSAIALMPPKEIGMYTQIRVPVSWYMLQEKNDPATGNSGRDYLVTYSSVGSGIDTDFTRIELYTYDPKSGQYSTSLAKSGLYGRLPVVITEGEKGGKLIEIAEYPKGNQSKLHIMQYSFPSPIRVVKETTEDIKATP